jgi:ADP-ribose pyrophosphatase YjhB (NUDIX family)
MIEPREIEVRTAARLLLIDASLRVLLFRHDDGYGRQFWATPGGGIENGETPEEAARREALEELGAADVSIQPLWTGHAEFPFRDRIVSQTDKFFLVTRHGPVLGPGVEEAHRSEGITEVRWWPIDEIDTSREPVYPEDLAHRVREHLLESRILEALDLAVRSEVVRPRIDAIVARVEQKLNERPDELLAWEPIPLDVYSAPLPAVIRSSWVFVLRGSTMTGAERHPNSHQRMTAYRGSGDFQTQHDGDWRSHLLKDDDSVPVAERWISIPPNVWHQGVVAKDNWVVVSFHTAAEQDLVEERPGLWSTLRQRRYAEEG